MTPGTIALAAVLATQATASPSHLLVVSGIGGDPQYSDMFHEWSGTMVDAARGPLGMPRANVVWLADKPDRDPVRIDGRSTKEELQNALRRFADRAGPADIVFVLLVGHGSVRDGQSFFNLPGPDISAEEFGDLLVLFPTQRVVLVNTSPASGGFVEVLSGPNRTIVTATKSGFERNEAVFGGYFVMAFAEDVADTDKDGRISVLEAFEYARREVERVYEEDNRLRTEHAVLDDNGDGEGSTEPDPQETDGALARRTFLGPGAVVASAGGATDDPVLRGLLTEKADLEAQIESLRNQKDVMAPEEYETQLEELVVELALKNREIREREGNQW